MVTYEWISLDDKGDYFYCELGGAILEAMLMGDKWYASYDGRECNDPFATLEKAKAQSQRWFEAFNGV